MFVYNNLGIFAELPYFFPKGQSLTDPIISEAFTTTKSLRFRRASSIYLNRTPSVTGNRKVWTWSGWIKRASLGTVQHIYSSFNASTNQSSFSFNAGNYLEIQQYSSATYDFRLITTQFFRDVGGWFHLIVAVDTTQLLDSNRIRVFINGLEIKDFSTTIYPTRNFNTNFNLISYTNQIGAWNTSNFFDGNMTDIYLVDGESLSPFNFGEIDFLTGVWKRKQYTGFFGTNGFYLPFNDNRSLTLLGNDKSTVTTNHWTTNNVSLIAGSTFDSIIDTPVSESSVSYYAGWNPNYGLQFRSSASTYLSRNAYSVGSAGTKWTMSMWVKRSGLSENTLFAFVETTGAGQQAGIQFDSNNCIRWWQYAPSTYQFQKTTTAAFSDTSVWYHLTFVYDTTLPNINAEDRCKIFVNGVRQTSFSTNTNPSINLVTYYKTGNLYPYIGAQNRNPSPVAVFDGIFAEVNFIDGQALTPDFFAETNSNGRWIPKTYTDTYGTNGFCLNFANRSAMTQAAIGDDASINNNQWTPNNFLSTDAIDFNATVSLGNYAVLNPLILADITTVTQNGNLSVPAANNAGLFSIPNNIQFYFEVETANNYALSIAKVNPTFEIIFGVTGGYNTTSSPEAYYYRQLFRNSGTGAIDSTNPGGNQIRTGIFGFAVNKNAGTLLIYHNGIQIGSMTLSNPSHMDCFVIRQNSNTIAHTEKHINFGQRPFAYTPPAGYSTLNTNNLPTPTVVNPASYMAATTYTGISAGKSISNTVNSASFQPDLVWIKSRSSAQSHVLTDSVRGVNSQLFSDLVNSHGTQSDQLTSFNLSGFSVGLNTSGTGGVNYNAIDYIAWQWKAGGNTSTNTVGSISASVNVDPTAGFSIVRYTGNGNASATVGHGLGVAPSMIICKSRSSGNGWVVYHKSLPANNTLTLNGAGGQFAASTTSEGIISTSPTNTTFGFTAGTTGVLNVNGTSNIYMAYCFSEIEGYSKFGSYTGNGLDDGPFVFCGFRPRWVMYKSTTEAAGNWQMCDSARSVSNFVNEQLAANTLSAIITTGPYIDILSNGFKLRTASSAHNLNGATYIFAAFAEAPSKYALAESSVNLNKAPENIATNSLRFRSSASAYLSRTAALGNQKTWTWSGWFKNSTLSIDYTFISGYTSVATETVFRLNNNIPQFAIWSNNAYVINCSTSAILRDPSAWYHIVLAVDTTQAINSNGVKIWINGVQQTLTFSVYTQNATGNVNANGVAHYIGRTNISSAFRYTDGYMTEINFVDGQALSPISFGEIDSVTGVWTPRRYTGSYGTNGFYLKFGNTASLGADSSGKGNNWTPNNFSTTLGATYDVMIDVPVNYDDGRNGRGNYPTWNSLMPADFKGSMVISDGNLKAAGVNTAAVIVSNMGFNSSSGQKYYAEFLVLSDGTQYKEVYLGIRSETSNNWYFSRSGIIVLDGTTITTGATYTTNDLIGIAVDTSANTVSYYKNNIFQGSSNIPAGSKNWRFLFYSNGTNNNQSSSVAANFGQRPFNYTPPTGFKALNTNNLPTPTIINPAEYISATTYTGTGSIQTIRNNVNNFSFQPDLVWIKSRGATSDHSLFDSSRGINNVLISNLLNKEQNLSSYGVTSFNQNGFSISDISTGGYGVNGSAGGTFSGPNAAYIAWQWKESVVAGFDIVTYSGTGAVQNVNHSLGVTPAMVIVKNRTGLSRQWTVYHNSISNSQNGGIYLNLPNIWNSDITLFNNTAPTSSQFTVGTYYSVSGETLVAYCFAEIAGFSKFGSYTGNGVADGPFVLCGFRPRFVMIKNNSINADWVIYDTSRNTFNGTDTQLFPNLGNPQSIEANRLDVTSNGFKLRNASSNEMNQTSNTFIFAAFAETPSKYALAR